jgi:hypothetical protein
MMQELIADRVKRLRDEIAELSEADRKDKAASRITEAYVVRF